MANKCAARTEAARSVDQASNSTGDSFPLVGGAELETQLGFKSSGAFRQALHRNALPVRVFSIPNRRGKFAFKSDIANWIDQLRRNVDQGID